MICLSHCHKTRHCHTIQIFYGLKQYFDNVTLFICLWTKTIFLHCNYNQSLLNFRQLSVYISWEVLLHRSSRNNTSRLNFCVGFCKRFFTENGNLKIEFRRRAIFCLGRRSNQVKESWNLEQAEIRISTYKVWVWCDLCVRVWVRLSVCVCERERGSVCPFMIERDSHQVNVWMKDNG